MQSAGSALSSLVLAIHTKFGDPESPQTSAAWQLEQEKKSIGANSDRAFIGAIAVAASTNLLQERV